MRRALRSSTRPTVLAKLGAPPIVTASPPRRVAMTRHYPVCAAADVKSSRSPPGPATRPQSRRHAISRARRRARSSVRPRAGHAPGQARQRGHDPPPESRPVCETSDGHGGAPGRPAAPRRAGRHRSLSRKEQSRRAARPDRRLSSVAIARCGGPGTLRLFEGGRTERLRFAGEPWEKKREFDARTAEIRPAAGTGGNPCRRGEAGFSRRPAPS